jgi:hypothetical protein
MVFFFLTKEFRKLLSAIFYFYLKQQPPSFPLNRGTTWKIFYKKFLWPPCQGDVERNPAKLERSGGFAKK